MKEDKVRIINKLKAAKHDTEREQQLKSWHVVAIIEALIYIIRRL